MSNFFQAYYDYTNTTEPPPNFHAWSAIGALCALLGKKCYIPQGTFTVFPNLYIVLVGEPGTKKSTAMDIAKGLAKQVESVKMAPDSISREALIDELAESKVDCMYDGKDLSYWQSAAFIDELKEFLGGKHLNSGTVSFLTNIWSSSGDFKERTRKHGRVIIQNPYFSLLGCCTFNWVTQNLKADVLTDGFARRTIFHIEYEPHCLNPWPVFTAEQMRAYEEMVRHARRIAQMMGRFVFSEPAMKMWIDIYPTFRQSAKQHSEKVQYYFSSKHVLVQKLCMCLSASLRTDMIVDSSILTLALKFLEESEKSLDIIFSGVGDNPLRGKADAMYHAIGASGELGIPHHILLDTFSADLRKMEFDEAVNFLLESGKITTRILRVDQPARYVAVDYKVRVRSDNLLDLARKLVPLDEPPAEECLRPLLLPVNPAGAKRQEKLAEIKTQLDRGILLPRART